VSRYRTTNHAIETPFDKMFLHVEYDLEGRPIGAWIAHKLKNETSEITQLVEALAKGFHDALRGTSAQEGKGDITP
jgi:hypothetical protein